MNAFRSQGLVLFELKAELVLSFSLTFSLFWARRVGFISFHLLKHKKICDQNHHEYYKNVDHFFRFGGR